MTGACVLSLANRMFLAFGDLSLSLLRVIFWGLFFIFIVS